jgi:hypothetical protein
MSNAFLPKYQSGKEYLITTAPGSLTLRGESRGAGTGKAERLALPLRHPPAAALRLLSSRALSSGRMKILYHTSIKRLYLKNLK